jgi:hypothetical protein
MDGRRSPETYARSGQERTTTSDFEKKKGGEQAYSPIDLAQELSDSTDSHGVLVLCVFGMVDLHELSLIGWCQNLFLLRVILLVLVHAFRPKSSVSTDPVRTL